MINKRKFSVIFFILFLLNLSIGAKNKTQHKTFKNEVSISWGWNRGQYTQSDLHLKGTNYNFTLNQIVAKDRQSPFGFDPYFKLSSITIPQYDFRAGYFFKDNWQLSFGFDHMKYVMQQDQIVSINGNISTTDSNYNGTYTGSNIQLKSDFLTFEHTDGLNYLNLELRRKEQLFNFKKIKQSKYLDIEMNAIVGIGAGLMYPKTNTHLLNNNRYDEFHIAGFGLAPVVALNFTFYQFFFVQGEFKAGYINMPDIRTTEFKTDKASQHFMFLQENISFGFRYKL
jgi:hypothetical protein